MPDHAQEAHNVEVPLSRALNYAYLAAVHASLVLAPYRLCLDYSGMQIVSELHDVRNLGFAAMALALLGTAHVAARTDSRGVWLGLAWLVLPFIPASNLLFPVGFTVAERVMYMPTAGAAILVSYGLKRHRRAGVPIGLLLAILLGARSCVRVSDWCSGRALWQSNREWCPHSHQGHFGVAAALMAQDHSAETASLAQDAFALAVERHADSYEAMNGMATALHRQDKAAEAVPWYQKAIRQAELQESLYAGSTVAQMHSNLGQALLSISQPAAALESYKLAVARAQQAALHSTDSRISAVLLEGHQGLAEALEKAGLAQQAYDTLVKCVALAPSNPDTYNSLGVFLHNHKQADEALKIINAGIQVSPEQARLWDNRGVVLESMQRLVEAEEAFSKTITLDPKRASGYAGLGVVLQKGANLERACNAFLMAGELLPEQYGGIRKQAQTWLQKQKPAN